MEKQQRLLKIRGMIRCYDANTLLAVWGSGDYLLVAARIDRSVLRVFINHLRRLDDRLLIVQLRC